jgi:hypothetical protein
MTRATRRNLGRRLSFWMVALALGYVAWCSAWDGLIVPGYRAADRRAQVRCEALGERPGDVGKWQDERGKWHVVEGIERM